MKNLHLLTSSSNLETYRMVQTIPENSTESSYKQNIEDAATIKLLCQVSTSYKKRPS